MYAKWLILLFPSMALAGGKPDVSQDVDLHQSVTTGVQVDVAGSQFNSENLVEGSSTRAYAFSYGLGDVDINDCLASVQFGTILFSNQGVKLNKWCAAEIYDAKGLYEMAAMMRCDIKEVAKHFDTVEECEKKNQITPPLIFHSEPSHNAPEETNCDKECEDSRELVSTLESRVAALETQTQSQPKVVRQVNNGITDEQKAALEQLFKE